VIEGDWGPGENAFEDRVKRAGKRFVVAHSIVPAVTLVAYVATLFTGPADLRGSVGPAVAAYALIIWVLVVWARRQSLRPGRWVRPASWSGGIAGFFLGSPVLAAAGLLSDESMDWDPGRVIGMIVGALAGGCLLGLFVARSLAQQAKRTLLEPFDDAVVKSAVELPWQARGDRKLSLTIGQDRVTLRGNYGELRGFTKSHPLNVITEARQVVDDHGGAAVRIVAAGDELVFPTDEPDKVLRALRERSRAVTR
jgi:hypothetical protein